MAENSQWRLPALSEEQKNYLVDARASGMSFDEITKHFREVYPDYATGIPTGVFPNLFKYRISQILNNSQSSAKFQLEAKQHGETSINVEAVPLVLPHVRLLCYQRLWDDTPVRTLQRVVKTADGEERVYRDNTRERLAILTEFRKELQLLELLPSQQNAGSGGSSAPNEPETVELVKGGSSMWSKPDANTEQEE